jgi:hypothetical protein
MWIVMERKQGNVTRVIGPFPDVKAAADWVGNKYTPPLLTTATIEKLVDPESAAKPNGR